MLVMLSGQSVEGEGFLDILFDPRAKFRVFLLPARQLGGQISAGFGCVAPIVEPAQLNQAIVAAFTWQIVERIA
jgi:hypothetical protein